MPLWPRCPDPVQPPMVNTRGVHRHRRRRLVTSQLVRFDGGLDARRRGSPKGQGRRRRRWARRCKQGCVCSSLTARSASTNRSARSATRSRMRAGEARGERRRRPRGLDVDDRLSRRDSDEKSRTSSSRRARASQPAPLRTSVGKLGEYDDSISRPAVVWRHES